MKTTLITQSHTILYDKKAKIVGYLCIIFGLIITCIGTINFITYGAVDKENNILSFLSLILFFNGTGTFLLRYYYTYKISYNEINITKKLFNTTTTILYNNITDLKYNHFMGYILISSKCKTIKLDFPLNNIYPLLKIITEKSKLTIENFPPQLQIQLNKTKKPFE